PAARALRTGRGRAVRARRAGGEPRHAAVRSSRAPQSSRASWNRRPLRDPHRIPLEACCLTRRQDSTPAARRTVTYVTNGEPSPPDPLSLAAGEGETIVT